MNILRYVGSSQDTAVTLSAIADAAGVSRREVEQAIQQARLDGIPLITSGRGVWRAQTPQEAREWVKAQRSRAIHLMESAAGVERWADQQDSAGQASLWEAA